MLALTSGAAWAGVLAIMASLAVRRIRDLLALDGVGDVSPAISSAGYIYEYENGGRYRFRIQRAGGGFRAYILQSPPYGGRPDSFHITHRVREGDTAYVCWNQPIPTAVAAEAVARLWADKTRAYIRTGVQF